MKGSSRDLLFVGYSLLLIIINVCSRHTWIANIPCAIGMLVFIVWFFVDRKREKGEERKDKQEE